MDRDFKKWLFAIATNVQRDKWRWKNRWSALLDNLAKLPGRLSPTPEQRYEQRMDQDLLYSCLETLNENHRIPLLLYYVQGFSQEEISQMLNIPPGTVKSRLHHGKRKLKQMLEVANHG